MRVPLLHEATPILAEVPALDDARRLGPLRPLGRRRELDLPRVLAWSEHGEGQAGAVGRPLEIAGVLGDPRDLRDSASRVHPSDVDLALTGRARRQVGDARAVGGPAG